MAPEPAAARQLPHSSSFTGSIAFLPPVRDGLVPVASSTHKASWVSATRHMLLGHPVGLCVSVSRCFLPALPVDDLPARAWHVGF